MNIAKLQILTSGIISMFALSFSAIQIEKLKNDSSNMSDLSLTNQIKKKSSLSNIETSTITIESVEKKTKRVVIVGGGMSGIGIASKLKKNGVENITVIEPNYYNYYQPLWSLVSAGIKTNNESKRPVSKLLPKDVNLVKASAKVLIPENNKIELDTGEIIVYDYLILAAGIKPDWNSIDGLKKSIEKDDTGVLSVYDYNYCQKSEKEINNFKRGGNIIFTVPNSAVKCIGCNNIWMIEEKLRNSDDKGLRFFTSIKYFSPTNCFFGIKYYSDILDNEAKNRDIVVIKSQELIAIDGLNKQATFKSTKDGKVSIEDYTLLYVIPPLITPDFIKKSKLADANGFVDVNENTLQSKIYPNVFAIGDCSNSPNSKSFCSIISQAPVLIHNINQVMKKEKPNAYYDGYRFVIYRYIYFYQYIS